MAGFEGQWKCKEINWEGLPVEFTCLHLAIEAVRYSLGCFTLIFTHLTLNWFICESVWQMKRDRCSLYFVACWNRSPLHVYAFRRVHRLSFPIAVIVSNLCPEVSIWRWFIDVYVCLLRSIHCANFTYRSVNCLQKNGIGGCGTRTARQHQQQGCSRSCSSRDPAAAAAPGELFLWVFVITEVLYWVWQELEPKTNASISLIMWFFKRKYVWVEFPHVSSKQRFRPTKNDRKKSCLLSSRRVCDKQG